MLKELNLTILGRPCSKKNSRKARLAHTKSGKAYTFMVPGDNYERFRTSAIDQLRIVRLVEKFGGEPVYIEYKFYKPGNELQDGDNAQQSINDILQDKYVKIIDDDKQILSWKGDIYPGSGEWKTEVYIRQLHCNTDDHVFELESVICTVCGWTKMIPGTIGGGF